jgi:predicted enzyme related to lactoylglutathione lyase
MPARARIWADEEGVAMSSAPPRRPGTVVWVDLTTPDVEKASRFYERLLGWRHEPMEGDVGAYLVAWLDDGQVGGMMAPPPGAPPAPRWTAVVASKDLDAAVEAVPRLGGTVVEPPAPIPGDARIALVADPAGAALALLESPATDRGILWGAPGSASWIECLSSDPVSSRSFYEALLGWKGEEGSGGYVVFTVDGERVGGLMSTPVSLPADAPSYWLVYFGVADVAAACDTARDAGGVVLEPVHDIPEGRFAVLEDATGAVFAVFEGNSG